MKKTKSLFKVISLFVTCLVMILSFFTLPNFFGEVHANELEYFEVTYKNATNSLTIRESGSTLTKNYSMDGYLNSSKKTVQTKSRHVVLFDVSETDRTVVSGTSYSSLTYSLEIPAGTTVVSSTKNLDFSINQTAHTVGGGEKYYDMVITGWKIVSITGVNNVVYTSVNNEVPFTSKIGYIIAKNGWYAIPDGVKAITVEPYFGMAIYVRSPYTTMKYSSNRLWNEEESQKASGSTTPLSNDANFGTSQSDAVSTLKRAYDIVPNDANRTVYDNIIVLCGDMWEVFRARESEFRDTSEKSKLDLNKIGTLYNYFYGNTANSSSITSYIGFVNYNKAKPATISALNDSDGKPYDLVMTGSRYDIHVTSSVRFDNVNIRGFVNNIDNYQNGKFNISLEGRQINIQQNGIVFETTETVTSGDQTQIRFAYSKYGSAKHIDIKGGSWTILMTHGTNADRQDGDNYDDNNNENNYAPFMDFTDDNINEYIEIGGKAYINYVSTGFASNGVAGATYSIVDPPDIIVNGGYVHEIYGTGKVAGSNVVGNVNIDISGGHVNCLYGATYGSVRKCSEITDTIKKPLENDGNVNINISDGIVDTIYGGGQVFLSKISGNVNINITGGSFGDIYGGGKSGEVLGNITLNIDNARISGSVYGGGYGLNDSISSNKIYGTTTQSYNDSEGKKSLTNALIAYGHNIAEIIGYTYEGTTKAEKDAEALILAQDEWEKAPSEFPIYDAETDSIITRLYHSANYNGSDSSYMMLIAEQTSLSVSPVRGDINLTISNSTVAKNVFGGGNIALSYGDITVNIEQGTTVSGSIYGGGNGEPGQITVTLYKPLTLTEDFDTSPYDSPDPNFAATSNSQDSDKQYNFVAMTYTWNSNINIRTLNGVYDGKDRIVYNMNSSGELALGTHTKFDDLLTLDASHPVRQAIEILEEKYPGQRLIYSTSVDNLGMVYGNIDLNINTDKSINTVYGGGNMGIIKGSVDLSIDSGTITNVFGGSNQADIGETTIVDDIETITGDINIDLAGTNTNIDILFGANNASGHVNGDITINVDAGTYRVFFAGGQGEDAILAGNTNITINNGNFGNVFGGGYAGKVLGSSTILMNDGSITGHLYGGGCNASVNTSKVTIKGTTNLSEKEYGIDGVYGGGDAGEVTTTEVVIIGGSINDVYGGGRSATAGTTSVTVNNAKIITLYGGGEGATASVDNTTVTIESGIVSTVYGGGNAGSVDILAWVEIKDANVTTAYGGGKGATASSAQTNIRVISNDNNKITTLYGGGDAGPVTGNIFVTLTSANAATVYGGGNKADVKGNIAIAISSTSKIDMLYCANNTSGSIDGTITATISDSVFGTVYGGGNLAAYNSPSAHSTITMSNSTADYIYGGGYGENAYTKSIELELNDVEIINDLYGGGNNGAVLATNITYTTGKVGGTVYGGGFGKTASTENVELNLTSVSVTKDVYGGGNAGAVIKSNVTLNGGEVGGDVYGGGYGETATSGNTNVTYTGTITVKGNVYGGGNAGEVTGTATTIINGGTVTQSETTGNVYGGGNNAHVENVNLTINGGSMNDVNGGGRNGTTGTATTTIKGGTITNNVYGGGEGTTASTEETNLTIDTTGTIGGNVFGGGDAGATTTSKVTLNKGEIETLYGGGNVATVGTSTAIVNGGTINANVFGGGYGETATTTNSNLIITNGTISGSAYGGGQLGGGTTTNVTISGGVIGENAFGGGNLAAVSGVSTITVTGGHIKKNLYGAGEGQDAVVGEAWVFVKDGDGGSFATIGNAGLEESGCIFGGGLAGKVQGNKTLGIKGNTHLDLSGKVVVTEVYGGGEGATAQTDYTYVKIHNNTNVISEVYGGGLSGPIIGTIDNNEITVELIDAKVTTVFGGGYNAGVAGTINLSIIGNSEIGLVYGGNCESGNIQDTITVTIGEENQAATTTITEALYGAGYNARYYSMGITIIINDGSDIAKVYGGGYQADVDVLDGYGTQVHIKGGKVGEVFGGGYAGSVGNRNLVSIEGGTVTNNVYGGGYDGDTIQSDINITDGSIGGNVYGAGFNGSATNTNINITGGQIEESVFGGGYGQVSSVTNSEIFINLDNIITVEESTESASDTSSISSIELKSETYTDYIKGSVYGGGDMGTIGEGYIDKTSNTARVDVTGSTKITIENGHIDGSVFGGGNGEPPVGTAYNLNMGTVFGHTEVNINGGRIAGSVFGGGNQSRTYAPLNGSGIAGVATTVNIKEEAATLGNTAKVIFIGDNTVSGSGSIFGGGNTTSAGVGTATNASIPTTIGDTNVNIQGLIIDNGNSIEGSLIYILGGVYGDGNLCLVNGTRNVTMKDFSTGTDDGKLKTFFSLQRADKVLLDNTQIVLKGAIDLVEVGDDTEYSINRVGAIEMTNGSTFKLTTVVKYLGAVSSDYAHGAMTQDRNYKTNILTDDEINTYRTTNLNDHNTICVANGLYLELMNEDDTLGYVEGLFTLSLLIATPGEGGGFVYASNESTQQGDFICMTKFSTADNALYMEIIDGTCLRNSTITRYWYIAGSSIHYGVNLNGYIGTSEVEFIQEVILPTNKVNVGNNIYFVLQQVKVSDTKLSSALKANTYTLVNEIPAEGLEGQEIAIELRIIESTPSSVPTSVGFLQYNTTLNDWSIYSNSKNIYGKLSNNQVDKTDIANIIGGVYDPSKTYNLQLVLHKSSSVNTEITNAQFNFNFEIMEGNNTSLLAISNGTTDLHFDVVMNIVRLIPVQSSYGSPGKQYGGVSSSEGIKITKGSSLTINTITRYFPSSYVTEDGGNSAFRWQLMAGSVQTYYSKSTGRYAYVYNGDVVGCEGGVATDYKVSGDVCYYIPGGTGDPTETLVLCTNISAGTDNFFPNGTKITMIDMCNTSNIGYYYYEVTSSDKSIIDIVSEFKVIGSNLPLSNAEVLEDAAFYQQYVNNLKTNVRVTENLVFVFDFSKADTPDSYEGNIIMAHNFGTIDQNTKEFTNRIDIMDYITANIDKTDINDDNYIMGKSNYCEYEISATEVNVKVEAETPKDTQENFKDFDIYVDIDENTGWIDTDYVDNKYSVVVNYQNSEGVKQIMPVGMHIEFRGNKYYPERDGTFIVVPVETPGRHTLTIVSNLSGYDGANKFNLHIYSSADGEYYNNIDTGIKKDIELNVTPRVGTSLNITVDKQIIKSQETLIVNVKSDAQDLITFDVYKKDADGNFTIPATIFNDLENIALREIDAEGFYHKTFTLEEEVPAGTYVLIFNNGTAHTERVYIVVTDEEFLTN